MPRYLLGRALQAVLTLFVISILAFAVPRLVPGDPAEMILGPGNATPERIAALRGQLGLDRPVVEQYLDFVGGAVRFDFGDSLTSQGTVSEQLGERLGPSVFLVLYASLVAVVLALPLGVLAARYRNRAADHLVRLVGTVCYAAPPFLSGLVLVLIFSVHLRIFPVLGYGEGFGDRLASLTLPAITVGITLAPLLVRTLRAAMLETLSQDFIEAARSRGLSERRVVFKHALRNSMLPTVTLLGLSIGASLSFTVIVENVFSIPGLGTLLVGSVNGRDYPMIQALIMTFAAAVLLSSLLTDLVCSALDPRIRL
ncbi:ABC transporter permease [Okibacterium endophyticum]